MPIGRSARDTVPVRRSIDDEPFDEAAFDDDPALDDVTPLSWAVAISDDYADGHARVVVTVESSDSPGAGQVLHLRPASVRRLRNALRDALREIGEDAG